MTTLFSTSAKYSDTSITNILAELKKLESQEVELINDIAELDISKVRNIKSNSAKSPNNSLSQWKIVQIFMKIFLGYNIHLKILKPPLINIKYNLVIIMTLLTIRPSQFFNTNPKSSMDISGSEKEIKTPINSMEKLIYHYELLKSLNDIDVYKRKLYNDLGEIYKYLKVHNFKIKLDTANLHMLTHILDKKLNIAEGDIRNIVEYRDNSLKSINIKHNQNNLLKNKLIL